MRVERDNEETAARRAAAVEAESRRAVAATSGPLVVPLSPARSTPTARSRSCALREEQRPRRAVDQSRSEALTGIIGARRAWTVSMISPLSMPCR
jgi:hypothetical protein